MMFEVQRMCVGPDTTNPRAAAGIAHPELFPFRIRVSDRSHGGCKHCGKPAYWIHGQSQAAIAKRFGVEFPGRRSVCESSGRAL